MTTTSQCKKKAELVCRICCDTLKEPFGTHLKKHSAEEIERHLTYRSGLTDNELTPIAMDYGHAAALFYAASEILDDRQKAIELTQDGINVIAHGIGEPSFKKFAVNQVYEQTGTERLQFLPFLIEFLLKKNTSESKFQASRVLIEICARLTEPCATKPFDYVYDGNFEEFKEATEQQVTYKRRVSQDFLDEAWKEYKEMWGIE